MPLEYKEDWPQARERFTAFWEHEVVDRACIHVTAPRERQTPLPQADAETEITDINFWLRRLNTYFGNRYWGGEAIPACGSILGYAVFGGQPQFQKVEDSLINTIWIDPIIEDWSVDSYQFDPQNKWCQRFLELKRREYRDSRGKYLPALEGVLRPTEVLSFFRGPNQLCVDLLDCPHKVKEALRELLDAFKWINGQRFEIINADQGGTAAMGLWAPGRYYALGCDFSCLIGPNLFRRFVVPEITELAQWLDYSFYHLDGPNALQHVPALLEIQELDGIQFEVGAAYQHLPALHWLPLYKQIQGAGKLAWIHAKYDEVESLLTALDPRGVLIVTSAPSVEAANALLRNVERWSCRGIHPVPCT